MELPDWVVALPGWTGFVQLLGGYLMQLEPKALAELLRSPDVHEAHGLLRQCGSGSGRVGDEGLRHLAGKIAQYRRIQEAQILGLGLLITLDGVSSEEAQAAFWRAFNLLKELLPKSAGQLLQLFSRVDAVRDTTDDRPNVLFRAPNVIVVRFPLIGSDLRLAAEFGGIAAWMERAIPVRPRAQASPPPAVDAFEDLDPERMMPQLASAAPRPTYALLAEASQYLRQYEILNKAQSPSAPDVEYGLHCLEEASARLSECARSTERPSPEEQALFSALSASASTHLQAMQDRGKPPN